MLEPKQKREYLVIVRAGRSSLHQEWLAGPRHWDLAVSGYDDEACSDHPEAVCFDYHGVGKFDGIYQLLAKNPRLLDGYEYVWLPDDDLAGTPGSINLLFELVRGYDLEVAQPSLTRDSYFTHAITLRCSLTRIRYTNFVEVMAPVLKTEVLRRMLPYFADTKSGWGLDHLWARMTSDPATKCAILDEVTVRHTRPVGSVLARSMSKTGETGASEEALLSSVYDLNRTRPICFKAVLKGGYNLRGRFACGLLQFVAQAPWLSRGRSQRRGPRAFLGSLYSHFRHRVDLTPLPARAPGS